jgi:hypothetical protein
MTSLFVVWVPASGIGTEAALMELRGPASKGDLVLDGPIEIEDSVPSSETARFARAAELLKEVSRRKRIAEGLARAKAQGRRIGRPPIDRPVTAAQIVLDRARGRSWSSIEAEYRIPKTSARRLYQNELRRQTVHRASRQEAKRP